MNQRGAGKGHVGQSKNGTVGSFLKRLCVTAMGGTEITKKKWGRGGGQ